MIAKIVDGRTDLVFDWVAEGGDPEAADERGTPLIRWCAYYGDVSAIRFLVSQGVALTELGANFDLNGAAFHGHWRLCQYLIEQGADPNVPLAETGETPLHAAAPLPGAAGPLVIAVLLAAGADPARATIPERETGSFMRDTRTKGETPLHRAAAFAGVETIERLIEAGASREARDAAGDTPLSWASWHRRPSATLRLLCFPPHALHPASDWPGDHGAGESGMQRHLLGKPHC